MNLWRSPSWLPFFASLLTAAAGHDYAELFQAQFVDGETLRENANIVYHDEDPNWDWYNISVVDEPDLVKESWTPLTDANEIRSTGDAHRFAAVDLAFEFPFFGRRVDKVLVSTGGAVILNDLDEDGEFVHEEEPVAVASHAAPFLSSLGPGDDEVLYHDFGDRFSVQWTKHYLADPRKRQEFQLNIFKNGEMTIIYKFLPEEVVERAKETGYQVMAGLMDGYSWQDQDEPTKVHVYMYPAVHITPERLASNYTLVRMWPMDADCATEVDEDGCQRRSLCEWCAGGNVCLRETEVNRPSHGCFDEPKEEGRSACADLPDCSGEPRNPVCGTDDITYDNDCQLRRIACANNRDVGVQFVGPCLSNSNKIKKCEDSCPDEYAPVCGADGRTYASRCVLNRSNCVDGAEVRVAKEGKCDEEDVKDYDYDGEKNDVDDDDDCEKPCSGEAKYVCANKERVFTNRCVMEKVACQEKLVITEWSLGTCSDLRDDDKGDRSTSESLCPAPDGCARVATPVCASNGITYANECIMRQLSCQFNLELTVQKKGACEDREVGPDCEPGICTREYAPVCGSDGRTYGNRCLFDAMVKCDPTLDMVSKGSCDDFEDAVDEVKDRIKERDRSDDDDEDEDEDGDDEDDDDDDGESRSKFGRALKGAIFLVMIAGIVFTAFVLIRAYKRSTRMRAHHASTINGFGVSTIRSDSSNDGDLPPPAPTTATSTAPPPPPSPPVTETGLTGALGGAAAAAVLAATSAGQRYDRLPLVPNLEEEDGGRGSQQMT